MKTLIAIFILSFCLALILTPVAGMLGCWGNAVDRPDGQRKTHRKPTPRTGGIALALSFCLTFWAIQFFQIDDLKIAIRFTEQNVWSITAGLLVFGVGLWDDYQRLNHRIKFIVQLVAASIIYFDGLGIHYFSVFGWQFGPVLSYLLTVFWILLLINAVNLLDGLDGLSAGICLFCSLSMTLLAIAKKDFTAASLYMCLCGTLFGFLRYNFSPATIFMGDGGSYFLGFIIAVISLVSSTKTQAGTSLLIPIVAMGLPIFDTLLSPTRRFLTGKKMFKPDSSHIHHMMVKQLGLSRKKAVLGLYCITALLCMFALAIVYLQNDFAVILFALLGGCAFIFMHKLGYFSHIDGERLATWFRDIGYVTGASSARRRFLRLQLDISNSGNEQEIWNNICAAIRPLNIDYAEMNWQNVNGESVAQSWSKEGFDVDWQLTREHLLKLELPLADEMGDCYGTLWLVKDMGNMPVSQHTLFRIEQLRRTVGRTLTRIGRQSIGNAESGYVDAWDASASHKMTSH